MTATAGTVVKRRPCPCHWRLRGVGLPKGQQRESRHRYPEIAHVAKLALAISLRMSGACICTELHTFAPGMRIVVIGAFLALGALLSAQTEKKPAQPAQAAPAQQPGKPAAQPAQPGKPAQPAKPATAAEPAQPGKPAQPAQTAPAQQPGKPAAEPAQPGKPAQPANPPHHPEPHQHAPHKSNP
jgi:hypothetical protein